MNTEVNIPLLRKAVEWAEAEAVKPPELREWDQGSWRSDPRSRAHEFIDWSLPADQFDAQLRELEQACGTAYCIAGYVGQALDARYADSHRVDDVHVAEFAAKALGIPLGGVHTIPRGHLFFSENTIEDVRRIAEDLAGERL